MEPVVTRQSMHTDPLPFEIGEKSQLEADKFFKRELVEINFEAQHNGVDQGSQAAR